MPLWNTNHRFLRCPNPNGHLEQFTVSRKRRTALTLCFDAIPKGKRYVLFPGKPFHTFPGIALVPFAMA
ncbi:MAG: hypothetical protein EOS55_03360 [Mesorhizobium sp.]|nr:MAG: hypothetical protein EOS55_03360 [Mesorhizobium sp.]